ncbi:MAG: translocation protein TolB [Bacteroidota bacterium]
MVLLVGVEAFSQFYHTPFGHNRIQYKRFDWFFYTTSNFEVYYYPGGQEYAREALDFLEDEFVKLTDILGYAPYTKTKIFIYNSIQDLQQSNIGIGGDVFTIGGKTDFVKLQVEIAYPGKAEEFRQKLIEQLSNILINDMMFGGSLAEIFQNSYLLSLPEWFIDGAAKYLAYGWSSEMDDYIRDYLSRKKIAGLVKVQNEDADIIGQSIWNFIAIRYGKSNISNILNLTRIIRNEENSIASTLGISFKNFLSQWQNYYLQQKEEINNHYISTDKDNIIAEYRNKDITISHVSLNQDGNKLAYTYHKDGKYRVYVVDLASGNKKKIVAGGYSVNGQQIDENMPLIAWSDNDNLGVLLYKRGYLYLNTYDINSNKKYQKPLTRFRQVESFSFNDNGRLAVISGDVDGKNDIFLISMRRNALRRITDDIYDDLYPVFIPGTAAIVFSSNRESDSVKVSGPDLKDVSSNFNLFSFDLDTTTTFFHRITNTYSRDIQPIAKNQYSVYYLSDQKGITNLFEYKIQDSTFIQISAFENSILDYDISFGNNTLSYIMLDRGRQRIFLEEHYNLNKQNFTPQNARKRLEQAQYVVSRLPQNKPEKVVVEVEPISVNIPAVKLPDDFKKGQVNTDNYVFEDEEKSEPDIVEEISPNNSNIVNTDDYVFTDDSKTTYKPESFFSNYRKLEKKSRVYGPIAYEPKFNFSNLITSFAIDPLRGFSMLVESEISDILENHRLNGGFLANTSDFKSGDIFIEYDFLKYWMDFHIKLDRKVILQRQNNDNEVATRDLRQKYILNKIEAGASVPLTNSFRIEAAPFFATTEFRNLQNEAVSAVNNTNLAKDNTVSFGGGRAALVMDNTIERGFNIYQGTRGIVEFNSYYDLTGSNRSFSNLELDLRHYQKIHRELTLAGRVFYGTYWGDNKQNYLVGGMQNWIFNRTEDQGEEDPLRFTNNTDNSNILFTEYVTNLRGFDYNELFGNSAFILNAELRFPVFRYLSGSPISSNFLRNFQLIGFYDFGSAWNGPPPIKRGSGAQTKKYVNSGFIGEISNFQNPWLASYGAGLRTVLLGYYLKVDVAKPIRDFEVGKTRFYFTLGLDF